MYRVVREEPRLWVTMIKRSFCFVLLSVYKFCIDKKRIYIALTIKPVNNAFLSWTIRVFMGYHPCNCVSCGQRWYGSTVPSLPTKHRTSNTVTVLIIKTSKLFVVENFLLYNFYFKLPVLISKRVSTRTPSKAYSYYRGAAQLSAWQHRFELKAL